MTTPNLELEELTQNQTQPHVPINFSLRRIDALMHMEVQSLETLNAPPGSPAAGDVHVIESGSPLATGAWAGQDGNIAYYTGSGWEFIPPKNGMLAWLADSPGQLYVRHNGAWSLLASL